MIRIITSSSSIIKFYATEVEADASVFSFLQKIFIMIIKFLIR